MPPKRKRSRSRTPVVAVAPDPSSSSSEEKANDVASSEDEDLSYGSSSNSTSNSVEIVAPKKASKPSSIKKTKPARKIVKIAPDADRVLAKCRKLRDNLRKEQERQKATAAAAAAAASPRKKDAVTTVGRVMPASIVSTHTNILEVQNMPTTRVMDGIESIALSVAQQVLSKKGFRLDIPSRTSSNQVYVPEWDRIVLGDKRSVRHFLNVKEARKSAITLRVLQLLHAVLYKNIHITKRDLFYTDVKLFVDQSESDNVLDDAAWMVGCTRSNLHVVASDKGLVVGRIQFTEDGDEIDCTKMGVGGKAIPPYIDKIDNIRSDAAFVLLVEKEAAYMRLAVSTCGWLRERERESERTVVWSMNSHTTPNKHLD